MIAFAYYGGKHRLAKKIVKMFPVHSHYVEPFAGSAAVLFNKNPSPIETINDLNGHIVNFFRVLRDSPELLIKKLLLTPYSRQEFLDAWIDSDDDVEQARRTFIRIQMDIAKAGRREDSGWSSNVKYLKGEHSSAIKNFFSKVDGLSEVADRLRTVQIENRPATEVITKYDSEQTFFYCDPPYLPDTRTSAKDYKFEMTLPDHFELSEVLNAVQGKVALSGYDDPIMKKLYPGWIKHTFKARQVPMSRGNGLKRQEVVWMNYSLSNAVGPLFTQNIQTI